MDPATEKAKVLAAQIDDLTNSVKSAEESTGNYRRSVGNYTNGVTQALQSTEAYNGVLGETLNAVQLVGQNVNQLTGLFSGAADGIGKTASASQKFVIGLMIKE